MKRERQISNAIALVQARRKAVGMPVSNIPTKVTDTTLYIVHRADGNANIVELTNDDTKKKVGITNFDGNKLAKGRDAVIDSIKVSVAKGGLALNNVDWVGDKVSLTKELAGAELQLIQDNVILFSIGLSDLSLSNDDDNYRDIASTPFLVAEKPIKWVLTYADGVSIAADAVDGLFIKIECRAIQAIQ
ncbi:hypothetical protein [Flavobacterium sp. 5]|uniref:hypothetical protein n=1 Tax=Flavobacterium sp. 5 TaxID=2035199 RepID=UPI000C2CDA49|nr:hypothetical protein [Flavobacterium sp. 5]PKB18375.1 hypothetical protein CLU82_3650 [Flavobacterium sp. 5]